jgi:hypothetical protein
VCPNESIRNVRSDANISENEELDIIHVATLGRQSDIKRLLIDITDSNKCVFLIIHKIESSLVLDRFFLST